MRLLENKIAVITGGSKGIGLATARLFIKEGATVIITARNESELMAVKDEVGDNLTCIKADSANLNDNQAEFAKKGIRVNAISPGYIETPLALRNNESKLDDICQRSPLENRFGHADEIANTALFLASSMSSYITGINLVVDRGLSSLTLGW